MVKKKKKKKNICSLGPPSHRDQTLDQPPPDSSQSLMTFILIFYLSFSYALDIRFPMIVLHLSALAASLWVRSNLRLDNLVPSSKSISCLPIQIFITKCGAIKKPGSSMFSVFFLLSSSAWEECQLPLDMGHYYRHCGTRNSDQCRKAIFSYIFATFYEHFPITFLVTATDNKSVELNGLITHNITTLTIELDNNRVNLMPK